MKKTITVKIDSIDTAPVSEATKGLDKHDAFYLNIAGIGFRFELEDQERWGLIGGYVQPEPENEYNSEAMGFYAPDGTLYGYVPESVLDKFLEWNKGRKMAFVGKVLPFVSIDGRNLLYAKAYVVKTYEGHEDMTPKGIRHYAAELARGMEEETAEFSNETGIGLPPPPPPEPRKLSGSDIAIFVIVSFVLLIAFFVAILGPVFFGH